MGGDMGRSATMETLEFSERDFEKLVKGEEPGQRPTRRRRGAGFWAAISATAILLLAGMAVGGFFVGQGTRLSSDEVDRRIAKQARFDKAKFTKQRKQALAGQRERMMARFEGTLERETEAARQAGYAAGEDAGYASGESAGYAAGEAAGYDAGEEEGYAAGELDGWNEGFDEGTCYTPGTYIYVC